MQERLQKIIAQAGVTSRRHAEELITQGCVTVNGQLVTELGSKADPDQDHIKVNGKLLRPPGAHQYLILHKPQGYLTTVRDPEGRPTVMQLLRGLKGRVFPVGRLDFSTEGLLLLTNDGALAHALMHPRYEVPKRYEVKAKGILTDRQIEKLVRGVHLADGKTAPCRVKKLGKREKNSWLEVVIHEGRNRQVRRMFEAIGARVLKLRRVGYGPLTLQALPLGRYRRLTPTEVAALRKAVGGGRIDTARR